MNNLSKCDQHKAQAQLNIKKYVLKEIIENITYNNQ